MPAMGPDPQLTPRASTPAWRRAVAASAAVVPSATRRSSPKLSEATMGRSQARRAASTAASRWPTSLAVSIMTRSMPPSRRPSSCSLAARPASMSGRWLGPWRGELTGPIEPATSTSRAGDLARLAGQLRGAPVEEAGAVGQAERRETHAVGAEGVRLDDLGAGRDVLAVDGRDELGTAQHELVERGALRHAAAVEQRAHGAVEQQGARGEPRGEGAARVREGRGARSQGHRVPRTVPAS